MDYEIPIEIFPIEEDGYHIKLRALLNQIEVTLLVDTGASKSVFDESKLAQLLDRNDFETDGKLSTGLGTNSMESKVAVLQELKLQELIIEQYEVAVLDLSHVNESYANLNLEPIDGVIGSDLLLQYDSIIDYGKSTLMLKG